MDRVSVKTKKRLIILAVALIIFPIAILVLYIASSLWWAYTSNDMLPLVLILISVESNYTVILIPYYALWVMEQPNITSFLETALVIYIVVVVRFLPFVLSLFFGKKRKLATTVGGTHGTISVYPKSKCFFCGANIPENATHCPRCGSARLRCSVCNQDIVSGARLFKCPHCGALSHREHLAEAEELMEKGSCPKCGEKLKKIKIITPKAKCFYCGLEIPRDAEYCPHCGEARVRCSVCLGDIASGEQFVKCPYCGILCHRDHLSEWIKVKGYCPNCRQRLKEIDIA
jgi:transcription elongation factor Elf1